MGKLVLPIVHFSRLPPLFCLSFGAFLGIVLTAFILGQRADQKRSELVLNYGNALVKLVAQDAAEPMVSGDMLSLHAVMQDVVAIPRVQLAAVHNVNQELLVQAGNILPKVNYQLFTAPIPLHDSMAGYVTITMDVGFPDETVFYWVFIATVLLLLLMALLALYEMRFEVFSWSKPSISLDIESDANVSQDLVVREGDFVHSNLGDQSREPVAVPAEAAYADLIISLTNYPKLEKQLSDIVFSRRVGLFERQCQKVLALYNGQQIEAPGMEGVYCLRFQSQDSLSEAVFSAVCTSFLIQHIERPQKIKFLLLAEICHEDSDIKLVRSDCGIFVQKSLFDEFLGERLYSEEAVNDRLRITGFRDQYAVLLEQQVEQLQVFL